MIHDAKRNYGTKFQPLGRPPCKALGDPQLSRVNSEATHQKRALTLNAMRRTSLSLKDLGARAESEGLHADIANMYAGIRATKEFVISRQPINCNEPVINKHSNFRCLRHWQWRFQFGHSAPERRQV